MTTIDDEYLRWLETAARILCSLHINQLTGPQDQQVTRWVLDKQYRVYTARESER